MLAALLVATACGSPGQPPGPEIDVTAWPRVLEAARGQSVNLFMWGGSANINRFVDDVYAPELARRFGITLERIPVADTVHAVDIVLNELKAGRRSGGSIDLIWINGENFAALRRADALLTGWSTRLPNARLIDWESSAVARDFGLPVDGAESPWGSAQFQIVYDSARMDAAEVPRSYRELLQWARAHPGRLTYPAPPAFHGTRFVKQAFYELTGGAARWQGEFDREAYGPAAASVFSYLQDLDPHLWRGGRTYPDDIAALDALFANGEVDFTFTQLPAGIGSQIADGTLPPTARPYVFDTGTIGDFHYLGIPVNASHPQAAMVFANMVLEPRLQAMKLDPNRGWGDGPAISLQRLTPAERSMFDEILARLGDTAVDPTLLDRVREPELVARYTIELERDWDAYVRQDRTIP